MSDLSDFGGGLDDSALAADRRDDGQGALGVRCDIEDCDTDVVALDDGWEFDRGVCCRDCIDYQDRHGHWPDEDVEICIECRIDDGAIPHDCEESGADAVLLKPGDECEYCGSEPELTVSEDGLWLPAEFAAASRLIIRTPTKTVDWRAKGEDANRRVHPSVTPADWDPDYLKGEGRTAEIRNDECLPGDDGVSRVGLLIAGTGEQHWFPVDIQDGGSA